MIGVGRSRSPRLDGLTHLVARMPARTVTSDRAMADSAQVLLVHPGG